MKRQRAEKKIHSGKRSYNHTKEFYLARYHIDLPDVENATRDEIIDYIEKHNLNKLKTGAGYSTQVFSNNGLGGGGSNGLAGYGGNESGSATNSLLLAQHADPNELDPSSSVAMVAASSLGLPATEAWFAMNMPESDLMDSCIDDVDEVTFDLLACTMTQEEILLKEMEYLNTKYATLTTLALNNPNLKRVKVGDETQSSEYANNDDEYDDREEQELYNGLHLKINKDVKFNKLFDISTLNKVDREFGTFRAKVKELVQGGYKSWYVQYQTNMENNTTQANGIALNGLNYKPSNVNLYFGNWEHVQSMLHKSGMPLHMNGPEITASKLSTSQLYLIGDLAIRMMMDSNCNALERQIWENNSNLIAHELVNHRIRDRSDPKFIAFMSLRDWHSPVFNQFNYRYLVYKGVSSPIDLRSALTNGKEKSDKHAEKHNFYIMFSEFINRLFTGLDFKEIGQFELQLGKKERHLAVSDRDRKLGWRVLMYLNHFRLTQILEHTSLVVTDAFLRHYLHVLQANLRFLRVMAGEELQEVIACVLSVICKLQRAVAGAAGPGPGAGPGSGLGSAPAHAANISGLANGLELVLRKILVILTQGALAPASDAHPPIARPHARNELLIRVALEYLDSLRTSARQEKHAAYLDRFRASSETVKIIDNIHEKLIDSDAYEENSVHYKIKSWHNLNLGDAELASLLEWCNGL